MHTLFSGVASPERYVLLGHSWQASVSMGSQVPAGLHGHGHGQATIVMDKLSIPQLVRQQAEAVADADLAPTTVQSACCQSRGSPGITEGGALSGCCASASAKGSGGRVLIARAQRHAALSALDALEASDFSLVRQAGHRVVLAKRAK